MPTDVARAAVVLLTTYWLHSALLIAAAWLLVRCGRVKSHALAERLWKLAAVLPLVTAPVQMAGGFSGLPVDLSRGWNESPERVVVSGSEADDTQGETPPVREAVRLESEEANALIEEFLAAKSQGIAKPPVPWEPADAAASDSAVVADIPPPPAVDPAPAAVEIIKPPVPIAFENHAAERPPAVASHAAPAGPESPQSRLSPIVHCLGAAAVLLLVLGCVRLLVQSLVFRRRLAEARVLETGPAHRALRRLTRDAGRCRGVTLLESKTLSEPVAFGVVRPRIVLPEGIERRLQPDELRALLAHELAHLLRGDSLWLWIGRVLCSCFALQPLNFLARRRWQEAEEHLCDDWAVRHGAGDFALARCLTRIAEWRLAARRPGAPALAAGGRESTLAQRIERLVARDRRRDPWGTGLRRRVPALVASLLAFSLIWCGPRTAVPGHSDAAAGPRRAVGDVSFADVAADGSGLDEEWRLLDVELDRLERQMDRLNELLSGATTTPEIEEIGSRLRLRMNSLRQRRRALPDR